MDKSFYNHVISKAEHHATSAVQVINTLNALLEAGIITNLVPREYKDQYASSAWFEDRSGRRFYAVWDHDLNTVVIKARDGSDKKYII
jgi:hypothetical protein